MVWLCLNCFFVEGMEWDLNGLGMLVFSMECELFLGCSPLEWGLGMLVFSMECELFSGF